MGWVSDEWRIADAVDLFEVLDWARDHADGRTFVLYVERVESGELGLIKLAGTDPTESP
jgi:hypothetical protein